MARARLEPGQIGKVGYTTLASGAVQATAKMRDDMGEPHRLKASSATADEALAALEAQAARVRFSAAGPLLRKDATIAEACTVFMHDKTAEGLVVDSTLETYRFCIDNVIVPQCGALRLKDLSVLRCNRIFQAIREEKSLSSARKAKSVLSMVCTTGIEHEVLTVNPVRDTRRLPMPEKKESVLTPEQLIVVRDLMREWRKHSPHRGPRPNVELLENVMWIMVGTSARIGEVLGLRRCDVDVTTNPATVIDQRDDEADQEEWSVPPAFAEAHPSEEAHRGPQLHRGGVPPSTRHHRTRSRGLLIHDQEQEAAQRQQLRTSVADLHRRQSGGASCG